MLCTRKRDERTNKQTSQKQYARQLKLGFSEVFIFFLISALNIDYGCLSDLTYATETTEDLDREL